MISNKWMMLALAISLGSACGDAGGDNGTSTDPDWMGTSSGKSDGTKSDDPTPDVDMAALYLGAIDECHDANGEREDVMTASGYAALTGCIQSANEALFLAVDQNRDDFSMETLGSINVVANGMRPSVEELCELAGPTNARTYIHETTEDGVAGCVSAHVEDMGLFAVDYAFPESTDLRLSEATAEEIQRRLFPGCFADLDSSLDGLYDSGPADAQRDAEIDAYDALTSCMRDRNEAQATAMAERLPGDVAENEERIWWALTAVSDKQATLCGAAVDAWDSFGGDHTVAATQDCEQRFQLRLAQTVTGLAFDDYLANSQ